MAAKGDAMMEAGTTPREARSRRAVLSPELIAILAVGVTLAGVMLAMMTVMTDSFARELGAVREEFRVVREDVREIREDVREIRDRAGRAPGAGGSGRVQAGRAGGGLAAEAGSGGGQIGAPGRPVPARRHEGQKQLDSKRGSPARIRS